MWQKPQASPFLQPPFTRTKAHGRHAPASWPAEPGRSKAGLPGAWPGSEPSNLRDPPCPPGDVVDVQVPDTPEAVDAEPVDAPEAAAPRPQASTSVGELGEDPWRADGGAERARRWAPALSPRVASTTSRKVFLMTTLMFAMSALEASRR